MAKKTTNKNCFLSAGDILEYHLNIFFILLTPTNISFAFILLLIGVYKKYSKYNRRR
jgi:hypothetical protein